MAGDMPKYVRKPRIFNSEKPYTATRKAQNGPRCQFPYLNCGVGAPLFPELIHKGDREFTMEEAIHVLTVAAPREFKELCGFGPDVEGPFRELIEPVIANNQCERAGIQFVRGTPCWLCGCVIADKEPKACEHIIPALRATMLKGLITTKQITQGIYNSATDINNFDIITKGNYLWSHENCNGSSGKGRMILLKFDERANRFVPDDIKCAELQEKIRALGRPVCYDAAGGVLYSKTRLDPSTGRIVNTETRVRNPFEAYMFEIAQQCVSINLEFAAVGNLPLFAKYALNRVELYFTVDALTKRGTPEERAAADAGKRAEIQAEIDRANELLRQDMLLANEFMLRAPVPSDDGSTIDQKLAYFTLFIEKNLLPRHNLEGGKNSSLSYSILGILSTPAMKAFLNETPISEALPIIYIITMKFLFSQVEGGHLKTLNTHELLPEFPETRGGPSKSNIITMIQRALGGRAAVGRRLETKYLFAMPDGAPDVAKFNEFICPLLFTYLYQAIYRVVRSGAVKVENVEEFKRFFGEFVARREIAGVADCVTDAFVSELFRKIYNPGENKGGSNANYTSDDLHMIRRLCESFGGGGGNSECFLPEDISYEVLVERVPQITADKASQELLRRYIRDLFVAEGGARRAHKKTRRRRKV